jgi:hypothetical protein
MSTTNHTTHHPQPRRAVLGVLAATLLATTTVGVGGALAAPAPEKLVPSGSISNSFGYAQGVAVAPDGNIYVGDAGGNRVQELTAGGQFVLMFGWDVNKTKTEDPTATQQERNLCTAKSGDECEESTGGTLAEQLDGPESVAVDPTTGDVYVEEASGERVGEYTAEGRFVWMAGREVNQTEDEKGAGEAKENLCTAKSGEVCKAGLASAPGSTEHDAFIFEGSRGDLLGVGASGLLYVGSEQRVQELNGEGEWQDEIPRTAIGTEAGCTLTAESCGVLALAVDATGDVYLTTSGDPEGIREFNPEGNETRSFAVSAGVEGFALDSNGHLAVSTRGGGGLLYEAATGRLVSEFNGHDSDGVAFNAAGELYAAAGGEVAVAKPVAIAELTATPATCKPGPDNETSITLDCALNGTVNPEGVTGTEAWFEWGRTPGFGERTPNQPIAATTPVSAPIEDVRPDETFYYRVGADNANVLAPEDFTSETRSFYTTVVPPAIVGKPSAPYVGESSVVFFGELNPENTNTTYQFQYGPCANLEACPTILSTSTRESAIYGKIATTLEASGLQPAMTYHYRLLADNEHEVEGQKVGGQVTSQQGTFTTAPLPIPQATTTAPSAVGATSATIAGSVDPGGQPAAYAFELGVAAGAGTQYGIVYSAASTATSFTPVTFALTGLQPGTTYAYRVTLHSGYGTATGETVTFTTPGLPAVLTAPAALAQLATPNIAFPQPGATQIVRHKPAKGRKRKTRKRKDKARKKRRG